MIEQEEGGGKNMQADKAPDIIFQYYHTNSNKPELEQRKRGKEGSLLSVSVACLIWDKTYYTFLKGIATKWVGRLGNAYIAEHPHKISEPSEGIRYRQLARCVYIVPSSCGNSAFALYLCLSMQVTDILRIECM